MHTKRTQAEWASIGAVGTFLLTFFIASQTGPRALALLVLAGAGLVTAGVLMLIDYQDTVERLMHRIYLPGRIERLAAPPSRPVFRWAFGAVWVIIGLAWIAIGVLAAIGVIGDPKGVLR